MKALALIAVLLLSGCHDSEKCSLLHTAYVEQDQLAPGWYEYAAEELRKCGIFVDDVPEERGKGGAV